MSKMNPPESAASPPGTHPIRSYPGFLWRAAGVATDGGVVFYTWMTALTALVLVGVNAWAHQVNMGLGVTAMTDHVSWGVYIGNFTFCEGLVAGAVMMLIPAYLYGEKEMRDVVIVGLVLALGAIVGGLAFITVDLGRVDRFWHIMPFVGRLNWPVSMLSWDVVVLGGYFLLNLHIAGYLLYMRYLGRDPDRRWYLPFLMLSIVWAVSVHVVTAFLYGGLGGRPFWNTAILAPRFLVSAFVTGPALVLLSLQLLRRFTTFEVSHEPLRILLNIVRVTVLLNMFLLGCEVFTQFYSGGAHVASATYLYFGLDGKYALVPWIWTSIGLYVGSALLLLLSDLKRHLWTINLGLGAAMIGVQIEKGMGLVVPGFVPSTLHELVEYLPNAVEWKVSIGIFALMLMLFTLGLKLVAAVFTGQMHVRGGR